MRRTTVFIAAAVAALGAGSFWLGVREGTELTARLEKIPRGAMSLALLEVANRGQVTQGVLTVLEGDIDLGLLQAYAVESHPLKSLAEPLWGLPVSESEALLPRLAAYRKGHPSPLSAASLSAQVQGAASNPAVAETIAGTAENDRRISSMVKKYAP